MTVLIITKSDDNDCVPNVMRAIEERGGRAFRFDTDRFPIELRLVLKQDAGNDQLYAESDRGRLNLREVSAVWYRRTHFGGGLPQSMGEQFRRASAGEARATILGMIASLRAFNLDPLPVLRHAGNKQLQLQVARDVGLDTPRTLITNDPEAVQAFAGAGEHGVVTKMLSSFAVLDEQGNEQVVFTTPIQSEDLEDLDGLRLCPMTFQEQIPKRLELRTTVVGAQVFTASIDSQALGRAKIDWRREGTELADQWKAYSLPRDVEQKLLRLMDRFNLNYGAIDLIVTPDGRHVFLEVNPAGEFFWLELHPGFPISGALADVLLGRAPRREHPSVTL